VNRNREQRLDSGVDTCNSAGVGGDSGEDHVDRAGDTVNSARKDVAAAGYGADSAGNCTDNAENFADARARLPTVLEMLLPPPEIVRTALETMLPALGMVLVGI
jgi:hypothetical protein